MERNVCLAALDKLKFLSLIANSKQKMTQLLAAPLLLTPISLTYRPTLTLNRTISKLDLLIMHFNVTSLQKNFDQLSMIVTKLQKLPDIIAITETKLSPNQIPTNIDLEG